MLKLFPYLIVATMTKLIYNKDEVAGLVFMALCIAFSMFMERMLR